MSRIDAKKVTEDYIFKNHWNVKENSTINFGIGGLILKQSEVIVKDYWLNELYDRDIRDAHEDKFIHIHDLGFLGAYCMGWSLLDLIKKGLTGVEGKCSSAPANHLSTLCNQMVNFIGIMSQESAGAQAFSSVDTYLSAFIKHENLSYKETKQCVQNLVFGLNFSARWGSQPPFSNFTLDWTVPEDLKLQNAVVGGKELDFTYGDCQLEMDMFNKAFMEVIIEGDANSRGHIYPIPTYSITKDFDWSKTKENNKLLFEMTAKYGIPYFGNYVNSDMEPSDVRSMCPLTPEQEIIYWSEKYNEYCVSTIRDLYNNKLRDNGNTEIYTLQNGKRVKAKINKFNENGIANIKLINGLDIRTTLNHLNKTLRGEEIESKNLTINDYIPVSMKCVEGKGLSYNDGLLVGAFLGDGSYIDNGIVYSLNYEGKLEFSKKIKEIVEEEYGAITSEYSQKSDLSGKNSCLNLRIKSFKLKGLIEDFVDGYNAKEKAISIKSISKSKEFRQGIIDGLYATDGGNSNRIYTSSKKMIKSLTTLFMSLGISIRIDEDNREGRLSDEVCYCIRFYTPKNSKYKDVYIVEDDYMWFRIKDITYENKLTQAFCLEILDDEEPIFSMANGIVTHNCRLRLDLRELKKRNGGFFGAGENTGSIGVVTLNLPKISFLSKDEDEFFKLLEKYMNISQKSLEIKRKTVNKYMDMGLYPYTKVYLGSLNSHFSTLGLVGGNEMCLNAKWIKKDMSNIEAQNFSEKVLDFMRDKLADYQEKTGNLYNLEATPSEASNYRFAKYDKEKYKSIITAGKEGETPYYTNSTNLPVGITDDIFEVLDIQDKLQVKYTSGTVVHTYLGERLTDWETCMNLVKKISDNYKLPYYSISPTYSICSTHGYINGEEFTCPNCGKETEVYSRITGYYRPLKNWNDGKQQEYKDRKEYII